VKSVNIFSVRKVGYTN